MVTAVVLLVCVSLEPGVNDDVVISAHDVIQGSWRVATVALSATWMDLVVASRTMAGNYRIFGIYGKFLMLI